MRFAWNRAIAEESSGEAPEVAPAVAPAAEDELGAVELLTESGRLTGCIATGGQRTSDWLNAKDEVAIHGLAAADAEARPAADGAAAAGASPTLLRRSEIVWVVPPPLPPNRHLRLHRRRLLVHLELDEHRVSGQVHVRPGADPVDQVLRGTRDLVPLTDAQVVSKDDPEQGMAVPVLIVNRRHVLHVSEDVDHASAAVPEPVLGTAIGETVDPRIAWLVADTPRQAAQAEPQEPPGSAAAAGPEPSEPREEPSGVEMLNSALTLLLEAGMIDVVEFQSIRARIPVVSQD